jgi:glycogen debranching enzyme
MKWIALVFTLTSSLTAAIEPISKFPITPNSLTITRPARPADPFTVAGERGALFGEQNGQFEAWLFPTKILSQFRISAELADYPVPIDVTALAAAIEVAPASTTITYSHAAFTVKQRMFAPRTTSGMAVLFEIASVRPIRLTFRFRPEMQRMWPAPNFGAPNAEWVAQGNSGYYVLHTDSPDLLGAVAMPRSRPGILAPYQERPKTYPAELVLPFDPKSDANLIFPLLITMGGRNFDAAASLAALNQAVPKLYADAESYYAHFFDTRLTSLSPDAQFDSALRWAEIAIDQGQVRAGEEKGLIAGYYQSADSARPGFAWFFGRDALWTSYAINAYGDFALTRSALEFLLHRQRADGKVMHEFSQSGGLKELDWASTPYFYAAADASCLLVMAMEDYVNASADAEFLKANWEALKRAYAFTRAHDSDGDGIYENTEGTGWVESWPPGMPHQEIYLASLDQQSAEAISRLAQFLGEQDLAASARKQADLIRAKLESEYYEPGQNFYAFSRNADGALDHTATIFPSVAWWSGRLALQHAEGMLDRWASDEFSTDWGLRDVSVRTSFYDPISYHQGSVWPLYTGWTSLAEYRAGRALSAYQHLMQNANLTYAQDLGAVTELLSGEFFQPLGRSSAHQVWSSAMVLAPAIRGLFGIEPDALHHTFRFNPHLPGSWNGAELYNVPLGTSRVDLIFARSGDRLEIRARTATPIVLCLVSQTAPRNQDCRTAPSTMHEMNMPLMPIEIDVPHTLPISGAQTHQLKVIRESLSSDKYDLELAGWAETAVNIPVRLNRRNVAASGGELSGSTLRVRFPSGAGYQRVHVVFSW